MNLTDSVTKRFLTSNGLHVPNNFAQQSSANKWDAYEDPTYLSFYFKINPYTDSKNVFDFDYLPQGLFLGVNNKPKVSSEDKEGKSIKDLVATNKLDINEPFDSAVHYLQRRGEKYRAQMMREFRDGFYYLTQNSPWVFNKIEGLDGLTKLDPKSAFRTKDVKLTLNGDETISQRLTFLLDAYRKSVFDAEYMRYAVPDTQRFFSADLYICEIRKFSSPNGGIFEPSTFLRFRLDYCEIDLTEGMKFTVEGERATQSISFTVGRIREINSYKLLGAILQDTWDFIHRNETGRTRNFKLSDSATSEGLQNAEQLLTSVKNTNYFDKNRELRLENISQTDREKPETPQNPSSIGNVLTEVSNTLRLEFPFIGNVYSLSLNQLSSLLNVSPNSFLSNFGNGTQEADKFLGSVDLSEPEKKLVQKLIGQISDIANQVPSDKLETMSIGDLIADNPKPSELLTTQKISPQKILFDTVLQQSVIRPKNVYD